MNLLDIQLKIMLNKAKSSTDPITNLNKACKNILEEVVDSSPDRMRYWINFIRNIHPLVDNYIEGQTLSTSLSDVIGEHIVNTQADTQSVDLKYYFKDDNEYQPYPVRLSIRNKIPSDQLKMIETANDNLNKNYGNIISVLFSTINPDEWTIFRYSAHDFYNTQDFVGYQLKIKLRDELLRTFKNKFNSRINLLDHFVPLKESIVITNDYISLKVEDKDMVVDMFGNKVISIPSEVSNDVLVPTNLA